MIAIATAASAAAIAMIIRVKKCPCRFCGYRYLLNVTKFIFTELSISSIDISMVIRFLRVRNPYIPIKNISVLMIRKYCIGMDPVMGFILFFQWLFGVMEIELLVIRDFWIVIFDLTLCLFLTSKILFHYSQGFDYSTIN